MMVILPCYCRSNPGYAATWVENKKHVYYYYYVFVLVCADSASVSLNARKILYTLLYR
jgi:hypothetical protein